MRLLLLYGAYCTNAIWKELAPYLAEHAVDYAAYPRAVTAGAARVEALTDWAFAAYGSNAYDAVIGHSLGGIVAVQLAARYRMHFDHIICLDTSFKPANAFYRNLLTPAHMDAFGQTLLDAFGRERAFYGPALVRALREDFDYTADLRAVSGNVSVIYGDRGVPAYTGRIADLNLDADTRSRLEIRFLPNACHMPMLENPAQLSVMLKDILERPAPPANPSRSA